MPLQNRVSPKGNIEKVSERGTYMGNRGILHNDNQELISVSKIKGWVTCRLEFKGRKRKLMSKGSYTELFFLDEATAFTAGHRPCAECRRERYNEFKSKWLEANEKLLNGKKISIGEIDKIIHTQRINKKEKVTYEEQCNLLPNGTMVEIDESVYLVWSNKLFLWSYKGYRKSDVEVSGELVKVLTPKSYVKMYEKGFEPEVHESLRNIIEG